MIKVLKDCKYYADCRTLVELKAGESADSMPEDVQKSFEAKGYISTKSNSKPVITVENTKIVEPVEEVKEAPKRRGRKKKE